MIKKRLTKNGHGDPVLTIVVVGSHDVYRLSHHLLRGQCEFADMGRRALSSLKRQLGAKRFKSLDDYLQGRTKW